MGDQTKQGRWFKTYFFHRGDTQKSIWPQQILNDEHLCALCEPLARKVGMSEGLMRQALSIVQADRFHYIHFFPAIGGRISGEGRSVKTGASFWHFQFV